MARYRIILQTTPQCRDGTRALRAFLKAALRQWGLRCMEVTEIPPQELERNRGDSGGFGADNPKSGLR